MAKFLPVKFGHMYLIKNFSKSLLLSRKGAFFLPLKYGEKILFPFLVLSFHALTYISFLYLTNTNRSCLFAYLSCPQKCSLSTEFTSKTNKVNRSKEVSK